MIARRTTRTALVTVAVAGLASGCLSSGSDSGGDSGGAQSAKKEIEIMFGFGGDQTQGFKDSLDPSPRPTA